MKIEKIEYVGIQPVYNCNVDDNHNYVCEFGIIHHNCVIDQDYIGEVHAHLFNTSDEIQTFNPGEKIIQIVMRPVVYSDVVEISDINKTTIRGTGGFGSTSK